MSLRLPYLRVVGRRRVLGAVLLLGLSLSGGACLVRLLLKPTLSVTQQRDVRQALQEASVATVTWGPELEIKITKGEPLFEWTVSELRTKVRGDAECRVVSECRAWLRFVDAKGDVRLQIGQIRSYVVIEGLAFDGLSAALMRSHMKNVSDTLYYHSNGVRRAVGELRQDQGGGTWMKCGLWTYFDEAGRKVSEGWYCHGLKHGVWTTYGADGMAQEEFFEDGKRVAPSAGGSDGAKSSRDRER